MNSKETILEILQRQGLEDALALREAAGTLDGTALIDQEQMIPLFDPQKDYAAWPAGAPVQDGGQVYRLITPHNAAYYPGSRPGNTPALWSITHTKDPAKARPWMAPSGTSGLYAEGECCTENGKIYRNLYEGNAFSPSALPARWEEVTL